MIPYRIEDTLERVPWMNWLLIAVTTVISVWLFQHPDPESVEKYFVLSDRYPLSVIGSMFAHADWLHLIGNMVFLWVFGNGVCSIMGNFSYGGLYLGLGVGAGVIHQYADGRMALGASGAICGVVAVAVTFFPFARVSLFWMLALLPRISRVPLWLIAAYWTSFDLIRAYSGNSQIAAWAHLGGTICGVIAGFAMLLIRYVAFTQYDEPTLLDVMLRRTLKDQVERRGARHRLAMEAAAAALDLPQHTSERQKLKLRVGAGAAAAAAFAPSPVSNPAETTAETASPVPATATAPGSAPTTAEPAGKSTRALSLRRRDPASPAATPASAVEAAGAPLVAASEAAAAPSSTAAPAIADCFLFDGSTRIGPITSAEAQRRIRDAADTTTWMFWQEGMPAWQPVAANALATESLRPRNVTNFGALGAT